MELYKHSLKYKNDGGNLMTRCPQLCKFDCTFDKGETAPDPCLYQDYSDFGRVENIDIHGSAEFTDPREGRC